MELHIQMVVDSRDPHTQADWWAETLGWSVEPSDESFIKDMVARGHAAESDTKRHRGVLVWKTGAAICPTDQIGLKPRQRILFQEVPEPKTVKNRVHWDLHVQDANLDQDEIRAALEARGARFLYSASEGPFSWHTMADPEGNEFCVA
jgi:hypothetical protein